MTQRQAQVVRALKEWGPLVALVFSAGVLYQTVRSEATTTRAEVEQVRAGTVDNLRFVAESLRVNSKLDALLLGRREDAERLKDICVAVRAGCR